MKKIFIIVFIINLLNANEIFYYNSNQKIFLYPIENTNTNISNLYKTKNDIVLEINDKIIVKFISFKNINKYIKKYNLNLIKKFNKYLYLFRVKDIEKIFDISNKLNNEIDIEYSQPDFIKRRYLR